MNIDRLKPKGTVYIKRFDSDMNLISTLVVNNKIVNNGLNYFASKSIGITNYVIDKIGISTGSVAVSNADTSLNNTTNQLIKSITYKTLLPANAGLNQPVGTMLVECIFGQTDYANKSVVELGLFTNNPTSEMVARVVLPTEARFTKTNTDYLSIIWKIQFG